MNPAPCRSRLSDIRFTKGIAVKNIKPKQDQPEELRPRNPQRADIIPTEGFALVVDGKLKANFTDEEVANDLTDILDQRDRDYCIAALRSRCCSVGADVCGAGGR